MKPLLNQPVAAVVFDMDGVLTQTRGLHLRAWTELFDAELPRLVTAPEPFTPSDYELHVDGRSREAGVRTLLAARGVPAAVLTDDLVARLAARKQEIFETLLGDAGALVAPGAPDLLRALAAAHVAIGVATASKNARRILTGTGLLAHIDALVDGADAETLGLASKPAPDLFREACRRLGVPPGRSALVEDSEPGITAGVAGGFRSVIGVAAEPARAAALRRADADDVVADVGRIAVTADGVLERRGPADTWVLRFEAPDRKDEPTRESLCTLANGSWGTRGAADEAAAGSGSRPGTYLAGVYDATESEPASAEEIVNAPNWLPLRFRSTDGDWWRADGPETVSFVQELDLRQGMLRRTVTNRDAAGRETRVRFRRIVSQADPGLAAVRLTITPLNWSGAIHVRAGVDAGVRNTAIDNARPGTALSDGRRRFAVRNGREVGADALLVEVETLTSGVHIALGHRLCAYRGDDRIPLDLHFAASGDEFAHEFDVDVRKQESIDIEKVVALSTSRDRAIRSPAKAATTALARAPRFAALMREHSRAWEALWSAFAVGVEPEGAHSLALHVNTFHVVQTLLGAHADLDAGVPARGLNGEAYGGHVFWDELFVYPLLSLRRPDMTRALLRYRTRRLPEAAIAAAAAGTGGVRFPWQSATTGEDVTPEQLYNPRTGHWMPDHSHLQRHVGLAVAYSAWQHYQTTGDADYLAWEGAPLIVGVARHFASLAEWDAAAERYSLRGVMGPDEFHDGPPEHAGEGLTDNVYTNAMTAWLLLRAEDTVRILSTRPDPSAYDTLRISAGEAERWARISKRLRIVFNADGTLSQFDGYDRLQTLDLEAYRARYGDVGRLDLILNAEGDTTNRYQVSKQPDCLMLLYLFSAEELRELFGHLGYELDAETIRRTVDRYSRTSTYGSTLSNVVHSWLEVRRDRTRSWQFLQRTLASDLDDIQGGTTANGIHLAAMAGSVDLLTRCYAGVETRADMLWFHPLLPTELESLQFAITYRTHRLEVAISHETLTIRSAAGFADPVRVMVEGQPVLLHTGESRSFEL